MTTYDEYIVTKPIDKALKKIPNRFLLTTVVARRWENLVAGAPPLVDTVAGDSPINVSFREVVEGKIKVDIENHRILLEGQPQVEEQDEPLFSAALPTGAKDLKQAVAEDVPNE